VNTLSCSKPVRDDLICGIAIILLEVAIRRRAHCGHKAMDMAGNNTGVSFKQSSISTKGLKVCQDRLLLL